MVSFVRYTNLVILITNIFVISENLCVLSNFLTYMTPLLIGYSKKRTRKTSHYFYLREFPNNRRSCVNLTQPKLKVSFFLTLGRIMSKTFIHKKVRNRFSHMSVH